ncbi:MucBP domain-containing protein [Lactococcus petauri]|uniref:MucBP domain-containing protein n=1 Tax=Lactococcus petauri TaxID=1940789 RepID=UPI00254D34B5|nr:MucBP domain-containing protein [Lactococcus petauri]
MSKKLTYLLLCALLFGHGSMTSFALTTEGNQDIQNENLERAFNMTYILKGNGEPLTLPSATMKIEKDDASPVAVQFVSSVGNALLDDKLSQRIKLSEGVTLQALPSISASVGMTYTYKYSVDGVKYSSAPPADIGQIKYIYYSGTSISYQSFTVDLALSVDWDEAHSGKNLMAEFFEGADETQVGQLYYDSYRMVTATYEDESGESLNPPIPNYGTLGGEYSTEAIDIPGYSLIEVPENASGTYTDEDQLVNYIYKQNPIVGADVTVKYVDNQDVPIADEETLQGNIGEEYESVQKDIDGYTFKEVQDNNGQGVFTDQAQTVTYIYTKNKAVPGTRTIKYLDTEGTPLRKDIIITPDPVHLGDPYKSYPLEFPGYTLKESQNAEGIITEEDTTTIFIYSKIEDHSHIVVHDSTLKVGEKWSPEDNFDEATDFEGNVENFSDIIVDGSVDTTKAGTYEVTYSIPEEHWNRSTVEGDHSATAKIVVSEEDSETDGSDNNGESSGEEERGKDKGGNSNIDTSGTNNIEVTANNNAESNVIVTDKEESTSENQVLPQTGEDKIFSYIVSIIGIALLVLGISLTTLRFNKKK